MARDDDDWRRLGTIVAPLAEMAECDLAGRAERRAAIDDALSAWAASRGAPQAAHELLRAGVPAAALATSRDLVASAHLRARGFWDADGAGVLPGLPWRASFGRTTGAAPGLGADTEMVLAELLGLSTVEVAALRDAGALG